MSPLQNNTSFTTRLNQTAQFPPPPADEDKDSTLYPPPPQFIDRQGTLDSIHVEMNYPDTTYVSLSPPLSPSEYLDETVYENFPPCEVHLETDESTYENLPSQGDVIADDPVYQNMSPNSSKKSSTSSSSNSEPPAIPSSDPPSSSGSTTPSSPVYRVIPESNSSGSSPVNRVIPESNSSGSSSLLYNSNLTITRRYRRSGPTQTSLVRLPSTCTDHPVSCYTPALQAIHATRRALRKVKSNLSKKKYKSGEPERNVKNVYDEYVLPGTDKTPIETYIMDDFVFSRL